MRLADAVRAQDSEGGSVTAPVRDPAVTYYTAQAQASATAARGVGTAWAAMNLADIDAAWARLRDRIVALLLAGQMRAAAIAPAYVTRVLADDGLEPDPVATLVPTAFAGRTAWGGDVAAVLDRAPIVVKQAIATGAQPGEASMAGLAYAEAITRTEVADAGRGAMEAAIRLEPQIVGYERYVNLPACARCILLAGVVYKRSAGFARHPQCDCAHRPLTRRDVRDGLEQDESSLFRSLSTAEQDRIFTADGARAIRSGADISQVVNARKGMSAPGDPFTTAGTGRKRKGSPRASRLSPQGCARKAGDDDALYLELLHANRYI